MGFQPLILSTVSRNVLMNFLFSNVYGLRVSSSAVMFRVLVLGTYGINPGEYDNRRNLYRCI